MKKIIFFSLTILLFTMKYQAVPAENDSENPAAKCMNCHKEKTPGIYLQWLNSSHGANDVACLDCHGAGNDDVDGFQHYETIIATLVTPADCGQCHEKERQEVDMSHHAKAGLILESADAYLANAAAGYPAAIQGCESCHGCKVKIDRQSANKLSLYSWPNSGIGRMNPDGSKGACNACHTRHNFSRAQARQPQACGKCHLGPDHPQKEVYDESKHGNTYYTNMADMNLKSAKWIVGENYFVAPTCATCHMSATAKQEVNHDVGNRISWNLRPNISLRQENWEKKRENFKNVCSACHGRVFVDGHFYQYDAALRLYNEKFARPADEIMTIVKKNKLLKNRAEFSNNIEWTYYELWHHEGRRARHGASMMGPDYTWWHGFYEVAKHFYFDFIPQIQKLGDPEVNNYIDNLLKYDPLHHWLNQPTDKLKQMIKNGEMQKMYLPLFENKE